MSDTHDTEHSSQPFVRSVFVILKHWKLLAVTFLVAVAASVALSLSLSNWYTATATFLPPQGSSGLLERVTGGLSSTLRSFGISSLGTQGEGYNYLAILQSRRIGEELVREFDLMEVYGTDGSMEDALEELQSNSDFTAAEDGRMVISVTDYDPERAAEMAESYFRHLNDISTELNSIEARNNRTFVELQYTSTRDSLRELEQQLAAFQERTKIYALKEQTEAAVSAASELYAQLGLQKVYLSMLERNLGADDAEVRAQRAIVEEMEQQIPGMGDNELAGLVGREGTDLPEEGLTYLRLYRDIEILSKLQAFLLPMYQQAVIEEQKQMHVLVPLDRAEVPERKAGPKRSFIVLGTVVLALILAVAFVLIRERVQHYRAAYPDEWESLRRSMSFRRES